MDSSPANKSDVTAYTVDSTTASGYPQYGSSGMDGNNNNNNSSTANDNGGKRDVSQFVKYLLEGAGIEEGSVDYAALRQELENITPASAGAGPPPQASTRENDFRKEDSGYIQIPSELAGSPRPTAPPVETTAAEDRFESVPVYKANSLYQTELETLSNQLASLGLPELPNAVRAMDIQGSNSVSQLQLLARSLAQCLTFSVEKIRKNAVLINELTAVAAMQPPSKPAEPIAASSRDSRELIQLEDQVDTLRSTARTLTDALRESTMERDRLRTALDNQTALVDSYQQDMDQMRRATITARQWETSRRQRAEQMVKAIRAVRGEKATQWNSKRPAVWEQGKAVEVATLEIAQVYEEKVEALEQEVQELKQQLEGRPAPPRMTAMSDDDEVLVMPPGTKTSKVQADFEQPPSKESYADSSKMAMVDEIQELQTQLDTLTTAFEDLLQEKEVLELKLLSAQPGSNVLKEQDKNRKKYSTSELIRLDKAHHRLQLKKIEQMSNEDCQIILKNICVKLEVNEIDNLVSHLEDIAKAIRLIPQMQNFIKAVDTIIWTPPRVLSQFLSQSKLHRLAPHKLADTLTTLESWRRVVEKYQRPSSRATQSESDQEDVYVNTGSDQEDVYVKTGSDEAFVEEVEAESRPLRRDPADPSMHSLDDILGRVEEEERHWEEKKQISTMEN